MTSRCLLIKAKDGKQFLTPEKNLPSLIEFAKTFGAEIHLVQPTQGQSLLDLKALTAALCDPQYNIEPSYKNVEKILPKSKKNRKDMLADADVIRNYIKSRLATGEAIGLKDLKVKYESEDLTDACLCNHLSVVRKQLIKEGHELKKVAAGTYCLIIPQEAK